MNAETGTAADPIRAAVLLIQSNHYTDAEAVLRKTLAQEPDHPRAHALLALALSGYEMTDYARTNLRWNLRREVMRKRQARLKEAIREARQGVALNPDWAMTHIVLSLALSYGTLGYFRWRSSRRQLDESLAAAQRALQLDPNSAYARLALVQARVYRREWSALLPPLEEILRDDPQNLRALNFRATALVFLRRYDKAAETVSRILAEDPTNGDAFAQLGWIALMRETPQAAERWFREGLRWTPGFRWARRGLWYAQIARWHPLLLRWVRWWVVTIGLLRR